MAEEETEEQGDEIAGLGVLASVPGGALAAVGFPCIEEGWIVVGQSQK